MRVLGSSDAESVWRNTLQLNNVPWVIDLKIKGDIVFLFVGFVAFAAKALHQITKIDGPVELKQVVVTNSLVLTDEAPRELITNFYWHRLTDTMDGQCYVRRPGHDSNSRAWVAVSNLPNLLTDDDDGLEGSHRAQNTRNLESAQCIKDRGLGLDFFFVISSLAGILGLPCTVIALGATEGIGYLSENVDLPQEDARKWMAAGDGRRAIGNHGCCPTETFDAYRKRQPVAKEHKLHAPWTCARFHDWSPKQNSGGDGPLTDGEGNTLRIFLTRAKEDPAVFREPKTATLLAREIGKKLFSILLKPDDEPSVTSALTEIGFDSMIAVEMRVWWKLEFGFDISVLEMLAMGTLEALGQKAAKELATMYT
ncbi:hypothetical protein CHU98_g5945 [Xylaria longipes]|nr:hypothetical protein CHU98_g5945 [Xylaria longipes]